ncbi:transcriptional regulator [Gluconobacter sp. DsW_056]|uniref:Transcriptional regulator n=2 Tax=Acetobacteraceae TaxID=433 RepID=A0A149TLT4_9PROT|nr:MULTISPECIES: Crp/Fnr family transcriptional regulator [Gluconobacter]KXV49819.1 transcriptional regulator [Gluconobacter albidus]MCP1274900.1 Crp/Fnr family transcriptional regulator [Gluconobacter albidus]OUI81776.1 transcriptional regulator [Gluconobacter sp. DsW_056]
MSASHIPEDVHDRCAHCVGRRLSVCSSIDDCDLAILANESSRMTVADGRSFIEEGAPANDFFVVTGGRVKLFTLLPDGRRQITGFAEGGDFLGLAASTSYAFGAEALGGATLCRFPHAGMQRLTERFPSLEHRLREEASRELALMQARMTLLGRKTARERVATFLIERCQHLEKPDISHPVELDLPMPRTDIADYLGLTIETVSRILSAFKKEKLISIRSITHITLLMPERISTIAEGME